MNFPILLMNAAQKAAKPGLWGSFVNFLSSILEGINFITGKIPEPFGGYGLAIILFSILMRLILLPLDLKSRKSNQQIQDIQPEVDAINKKYKNDADKKNKKTMELYQKHEINPMGGCLPMLLQFPLFFAMVGALNSISNREVAKGSIDAFLWIKNIWQPDSPLKALTGEAIGMFGKGFNGLFILPILAGVTSYYQMKITQPPDSGNNANQQMKGFTAIMPIMSVWFCMMYTASFAIYWVTTNVFQIVQQLILKKRTPSAGKEGDRKK